jgi:Na+/H+ antiporter NhaD/arsenite permease-like protein
MYALVHVFIAGVIITLKTIIQSLFPATRLNIAIIRLALATGTGGSAIIIGSAAGIAVMGIEKVEFFWYLKKISWLALIGFAGGLGVFILQNWIS